MILDGSDFTSNYVLYKLCTYILLHVKLNLHVNDVRELFWSSRNSMISAKYLVDPLISCPTVPVIFDRSLLRTVHFEGPPTFDSMILTF